MTPRAYSFLPVIALIAVVGASFGCEDLDGRGHNRKGNRYYRETKFVDAAANYEQAVAKVDETSIHYNLGLAYSKVFKPGLDDVVLLAVKGDPICAAIPEVTYVARRVCLKNDSNDEDRGYNKCDDKNICPSSATCTQVELCAKDNASLANLAAKHLTMWIDKQPPDADIKKQVDQLSKELDTLEADKEKAANAIIAAIESKDKPAEDEATTRKTALDEQTKSLKNELEETGLKFTMRKLMTQLWIDSQQFDRALAYWSEQLQAKPNDPEVMGNLAGINLKAGDYRKSIEWYVKVAETSTDTTQKVTAYSFIGNVAWSKLNSKTLGQTDAVELADLGIGALQHAAALAPKNVSFLRLQSALLNFRALAHGASWAAAIDRASAQDLKGLIDVVSGKAKPPGTPVPPKGPTPPTPPTPPTSPMSGGPAPKAGG